MRVRRIVWFIGIFLGFILSLVIRRCFLKICLMNECIFILGLIWGFFGVGLGISGFFVFDCEENFNSLFFSWVIFNI